MTKTVYVRNIPIGGGNPVTIQSMTNTRTEDTASTLWQVKKLYDAGAAIVRVSLPTMDCMETVRELAKGEVPIVGDIHFDHRIAIAAVENGIDKLRINPSNLTKDGIKDVVKACKERNIPIRIGINKGSVKNNDFTAENLSALALDNAKMIEDLGYNELVIAVKSSDIATTVKAYRLLHSKCNYPLHIGLTEAGTSDFGIMKSAIAIGSLLLDGIGDTMRVSLTSDPIDEVYTAKKILRAAGIDKNFVDIIACPTCSRTCIDVEGIAKELQKLTQGIEKPLKIAVMGCVVNGIGESKGAKFGVAGGKTKSSIFLDGEIIKTVDNGEVLKELMTMTKALING